MEKKKQNDATEFISQLMGTPKTAPNTIFWELVTAELKAADGDLEKAIEIATKKYSEKGLEVFEQRDNGLNYHNRSPIIQAMSRRETGKIWLGTNPDTGEELIFDLIQGYLTPNEIELTEDIAKFKLDGQVTKNGQIYCTRGQLYRAARRGAGTTRPTKAQLEEIDRALTELKQPSREMAFELSEYLKIYGGFGEFEGNYFDGVQPLSYYRIKGKIRGQTEYLYVFYDTPILSLISGMVQDRLLWGEQIAQEIKAIQQYRYTLELKEPLQIKGKNVKKRSFTSNEARRAFCKKHGITAAMIADYGEKKQPYSLTSQRIAMRQVIFSKVFAYYRTREAGGNYSPLIPYAQIWERCDLDVGTRQQLKQNIEVVHVILTHLTKCGVIAGWKEYTNKGSRKPDGVQISIAKAIEGGA